MLVQTLEESFGGSLSLSCNSCEKEPAVIVMHGYALLNAPNQLCPNCAKQLARKILEDICAFETPGGRHG